MNITKGVISRDEAVELAPAYVKFCENEDSDFFTMFNAFNRLKRNQRVLTYVDGKFVIAKVTKVDKNSYQAVDGPVIRVSNGEYS